MKGLFRHANGYWRWQPPMRDGRRPPMVALGTKNRDEAEARAAKLALADKVRRLPGRMSMQVLRYLDSRPMAKESRVTARTVLDLAVRRFGDPMVDSIRHEEVLAWKRDLEAAGLSGATTHNYLARLKSFFSWAVKDGQILLNPVEGITVRIPKSTRLQKFCTPEQRRLLIEAAPNDRIRFVLMTGFYAGLRIREIAEMRADWVKLWPGGGEIQVVETDTFLPKDKEGRHVPISLPLREFLSGREPEQPPFWLRGRNHGRVRYDPSRQLKRLGVEVGLPWFSAHVMRRSFATMHALAGTPLHLVARWLGDDLKTVHRNYLGYSSSEHAEAIV